MTNVVAFDPQQRARDRANTNTYRALLLDTKDLLERLSYADIASCTAARVQIEAINEVLTNGPKPV